MTSDNPQNLDDGNPSSVPPRSFTTRVEEPDASGRLPGCPCGLTGPVKAPLVVTIKPECPHHGTGTVWAAGYAGAVGRLRHDDRAYRVWWSRLRPGDVGYGYWEAPARQHLADYLESTGPDGLPVTTSPRPVRDVEPVEHGAPTEQPIAERGPYWWTQGRRWPT